MTEKITLKQLYSLVALNKNIDIFEDRKMEIKEYFNIEESQLEELQEELKNIKIFINNGGQYGDYSTDKKLLESYINHHNKATVGHMLLYTRFEAALCVLNYFRDSSIKLNVLDYGSSIADYGLTFGVFGHNVTLCDIEGGNLEVGKWRFEKRNLNYKTISININNMYPEFPVQDLIIAGDVLEHIRKPMITVNNFYNSLNKGGYLWISCFPFRNAELKGSHLAEACSAQFELLDFFEKHFDRISNEEVPRGFLLRKK